MAEIAGHGNQSAISHLLPPPMDGHDPLVKSAVPTGRNGHRQHGDGDEQYDNQ